MADIIKQTIDKLTIISEMSSYPETKQIAKVMIQYIEGQSKGKSELGFKGNKK
jgi:hypothetical protein